MKLDGILEKEWDTQLFNTQRGLAPKLGWTLNYHTLRSKGSRSGFPDRVLVRDRVIYVELKREKTKPSAEQIVWLDGLASAGAEVYLWRPGDLEEIGIILSKHWRFEIGSLLGGYLTLGGNAPPWTPGSLWISGQGRYDAREVN